MKILLTGCNGFIGFSLAKKLLENKKNYIVGVDNLSNYYSVKLKKERLLILDKFKNFTYIKTDLSNEIKIDEKINLIKKKCNNIYLIINNARPVLKNNQLSESMKEWDLSHSVLLKAPAQIILELLDLLLI